jgi:hypothetical protein
MKKILALVLFLSVCISNIYSQIGGDGVYQFLNISNSARVAALGGKSIAMGTDGDLDLAFLNPAILSTATNHSMALNYVNLLTDINVGYAGLGFEQFGHSAAIGIHYVNYGSFIQADETGAINGSFKASDYALNLSASHHFDSCFSVGTTFKPIYSVYESYQSVGLSFDLAGMYTSHDQLFCAAVVVRNAGFQVKSYTNDYQEHLPFEIMASVSQRLRYAPFRFSLTLQQLQRYNMTYDDPVTQDTDPLTGEVIKKSNFDQISDNLLRHCIVGLEFMPFKSLSFRLGYNHQRRKELMIKDAPGKSGFSWGFGLNLRKFSISYARAFYIPSQATDHFSFIVKLDQFYKH